MRRNMANGEGVPNIRLGKPNAHTCKTLLKSVSTALASFGKGAEGASKRSLQRGVLEQDARREPDEPASIFSSRCLSAHTHCKGLLQHSSRHESG